MNPNERIIEAKARLLEKDYSDLLDLVEREVLLSIDSENVEENTSFLTAKKMIRRQAVREGIKLFRSKIHKYATKER